MYLGRADMLCPPVVSGFVPLASFGNAANSMLSGTSIDDVIGNDLSVETK
jgi:hypothetical protein